MRRRAGGQVEVTERKGWGVRTFRVQRHARARTFSGGRAVSTCMGGAGSAAASSRPPSLTWAGNISNVPARGREGAGGRGRRGEGS